MPAVAHRVESEHLGVVRVGDDRVGEEVLQHSLAFGVESTWEIGDIALAEHAKRGVEVVEPRIEQFEADDRAPEDVGDLAVRPRVGPKTCSGQNHSADRQQIGAAVDGIGQLVGATSDLLTQAQQPLISSVKQLRTVAGTLDGTSAKVIAAINAFTTIFGGLGRATSYENAANIYMCSFAIAVGGVTINPAVVGGHYSKVCQ